MLLKQRACFLDSSAGKKKVAQFCPSDPMDCSPPGSSVHGIFQARVLEWAAIAFYLFYLYMNGKVLSP